jgi:hypothetical protein
LGTSSRLALAIACAILLPAATLRAEQLLAEINTNPTGTVGDTKTSGTATVSFAGTSNAASAQARFGLLKVSGYAAGSYAAFPSGYNLWSYGNAYWWDDVRIDSPGLTGTAGTISVSFLISAEMENAHVWDNPDAHDYAASNGASYSFSAIAGNSTRDWDLSDSYSQNGVDPPQGHNFLNQVLTFNLPITFGATRGWHMHLGCSATALGVTFRSTGSSWADTDLSHSCYWLGISEARDANGNPVAFTTTSTSGTNWAAAVPEPSAAGVILCLVVGRAACRRGRY